nr:hypothetical protein [Tanacetum cinerariifolium]
MISTTISRLLNERLKELQAQAQAQVLRTWLLYHILAVLMKLILIMELVLLTLKLALLALKLALLVVKSDTAGYDKSKVECFNCHRTVIVKEAASKAMVAIDGAGFDWSYMADDEVPTNIALMAFLDSEGNPQLELQEKGVIDSGCSRHMTRNMSYLSEYEEINGGYVAFGGDPKGGKITGKGKTITDTECVVLSPDFKLLDESQVLLRVPKKNNMCSVDLKNVTLSGGLTYLFAKATLDESNLWHRSLGHINFKNMNKLGLFVVDCADLEKQDIGLAL